jgi:hypothetical protein
MAPLALPKLRNLHDKLLLSMIPRPNPPTKVIFRGVGIAKGLVGVTPPEKIKGNYMTERPEMGNEAVVKMQIIRKAMHEDDRRLLTCIFSHINAILISLHEGFSIYLLIVFS